MSLGIIFYYLLWPFVAIAMVINWIFMGVTFLTQLGVECAQSLHEQIKEL